MDKLKPAVITFCILFWPLSLFLANTFSDFMQYAIPALLLGLSFLLLKKRAGMYLAPLLIIPFFEPKLAVFPVIATVIVFFFERSKKNFLFVLMALLILFFNWKAFWGQTIFQPDYEARQEVISKTYLYPNVFMARLFQNKARIFINKFNNNLFALVDPNNYFFNFHPREIKIDNQNLTKYPFMALVFALLGLYYLRKHPYWKFIAIVLLSAIASLSVLQIFDRNDFLLWVPLSFVIIHGINIFGGYRRHLRNVFYILFMVFTIPELIRIFLK